MSDLAAQYHALARYNTWMNARLYALCATLPDEVRKEDRGAFFRSVHGTLNHLLLTDRAWLGRFTRDAALAQSRDGNGNPIAYTGKLDQEVYADFALLRRERATTDAAIEAWAAGLTAEHLAAPFSYRSSAGQRYDHPLWWAVIHFFNHQTHHRGQLTTLLTQLGHDSGVTDLVSLLREPS